MYGDVLHISIMMQSMTLMQTNYGDSYVRIIMISMPTTVILSIGNLKKALRIYLMRFLMQNMSFSISMIIHLIGNIDIILNSVVTIPLTAQEYQANMVTSIFPIPMLCHLIIIQTATLFIMI